MKKVLIIGNASEFQLATTMLLEKMPDIEIITHEEAERQRLTTNKAFESEPIPFKIRDIEPIQDVILTKSPNQNKYSGEKFLSKRGERRKNARNTKRRF